MGPSTGNPGKSCERRKCWKEADVPACRKCLMPKTPLGINKCICEARDIGPLTEFDREVKRYAAYWNGKPLKKRRKP